MLQPGALAVVMGYQGGVAELVAGKLGGAYQVWMLGVVNKRVHALTGNRLSQNCLSQFNKYRTPRCAPFWRRARRGRGSRHRGP